jgi:hypothetical protein
MTYQKTELRTENTNKNEKSLFSFELLFLAAASERKLAILMIPAKSKVQTHLRRTNVDSPVVISATSSCSHHILGPFSIFGVISRSRASRLNSNLIHEHIA